LSILNENFFISAECAGFSLRFFAYVEASYRKLGPPLARPRPRAGYQLSAFTEKTCLFRGTFPRLRGGRLCAFLLMWMPVIGNSVRLWRDLAHGRVISNQLLRIKPVEFEKNGGIISSIKEGKFMAKKAAKSKKETKSKTAAKPSSLLDTRVIYCGDNLEQLKKLPENCVDLIYIDPPFNSNRNYEVFWGETKEKRSFNKNRHRFLLSPSRSQKNRNS